MKESLGSRLRRLREWQVWTQEELSLRSGVPVVTISRLENDYNAGNPRPSTIGKLAGALNVTPTYLLFGDADYIKTAA